MKNYVRFISVITLSLFIFSCSSNQEPAEDVQKEEIKHTERPEFDFRKTRWGMSKDEVKASESKEPQFDTENSLEYTNFITDRRGPSIIDLQAQTNYKFKEDKLIRAAYYFPAEYEDKNEYIEKYELIKDITIESKGPPVIDKVVELNPSAQIDPENKGQAVCDGNLIYGSQWKYPGSDIQLVFRGEGGNCYLTLIYLKNLPDEPGEDKAAAN